MDARTEQPNVTPEVVDLYANLQAAELRDNFFEYRRKMRPEMLQNWWTKEIADALQQFPDRRAADLRPRLAIGAPPQHGKSLAAEDFIAWVSGRNPELKTIFASRPEAGRARNS